MSNVSTHFANVHRPTGIEVDTIKSYSVAAADHLLDVLSQDSLKTKAIAMSRRLYEEAGRLWSIDGGPSLIAAVKEQKLA